MRFFSGNSLTTFLMFIPLAAVPLLAVFGIPEFSSVNASSVNENKGNSIIVSDRDSFDNKKQQERNDRSNFSRRDAFEKSQENPFEADNDISTPTTSHVKGWTIADDDSQPMTQTDREKENSRPFPKDDEQGDEFVASGSGFQPVSHAAGNQQTAATWQSAIKQLNNLGFHNYRLQPGHQSGTFHFSCVANSTGNVQLTHRFEAEGTAPLKAVFDVIRQIKTWRQRSSR